MNNIYEEFFSTLKDYLVLLGIDKEKGIDGCSDHEIESIEARKGDLPLAYREYLKSMGKHFLFEFMDAEDMSFDDLDYIEEFGREVFEENSFAPDKPYMVISERRNDYITFIYLDEGDNPKTYIMSEFWDEEEGDNIQERTSSFTDLILVFFQQSLIYFTASFHFVDEHEKDKNIVKKRYLNWFKNLRTIADKIDRNTSDNTLIKDLNNRFLEYYNQNKDAITKHLSENEKPESTTRSNNQPIAKEVSKNNTAGSENSILSRIRKIFK